MKSHSDEVGRTISLAASTQGHIFTSHKSIKYSIPGKILTIEFCTRNSVQGIEVAGGNIAMYPDGRSNHTVQRYVEVGTKEDSFYVTASYIITAIIMLSEIGWISSLATKAPDHPSLKYQMMG